MNSCNDLISQVKSHVKSELGSLAVPDEIEFVLIYPRQEVKIMRRVLKAQELGQDIGDISTLED